ncbi:hypothetical protein NPIL_134861 [Nephila pilipes]|uniref:Uncharacterized protein n=1 Tax=Nephila pilipes TaxID=299642 RepID=A0A8X6P528_NEPPI|nr:hypothetical protein NPIL_134861 [Nephila pilipes]
MMKQFLRVKQIADQKFQRFAVAVRKYATYIVNDAFGIFCISLPSDGTEDLDGLSIGDGELNLGLDVDFSYR